MNIALGFGSTETAFEERERVFVEDFLEKNKHKDDNLYNTAQIRSKAIEIVDNTISDPAEKQLAKDMLKDLL